MEEESLCLTWNNHGATYQEMLNHLRIKNILTDCTLACDGQKFSVHKLVLVTCSDFFKSLLGDVPCQHPIVYLRGVSGREMQVLIDFMYLGKIDVPQKAVPNLLSTAETLQIKGLGVLNLDTDINRYPEKFCKRKRTSCLTSELQETSQNDTVSSPLPKHNAYESHCSDRDCFSPKVKRDPASVNEQDYFQKGFVNEVHYAQNKDKIDSLNRHLGNESILSSIFKSSPQNLISPSISNSDVFPNSTNVPHYAVSSGKSFLKESVTLTQLTPLQPLTQEHSKTTDDYYENKGSRSPTSRMDANSYAGSEDAKISAEFENITEVKEEALDYTRSSAAEVSNTPSAPPSICHNNTASDRFPNEDASLILDHLSRNQNLPVSYSQDENVNVENGAELGRPFLCPICRKSFAKVAILKRHHLAHFRPYNCHLCPRSFTRREVLAEHVLEHNGADLRLPCPVCKMTIKRKRNLQAHIKVKHPEYHKQKSANNEALC